MLGILREAVGSWVAKIFIGILIVGFAIWGIAGSVFSTSGSSAVITAGKSKVSMIDFRVQYDRIVDVFSAQFGRRLTREEAKNFGLENSLLSQLRAETVMEEKARLVNIGISDAQLAKEIARNPEYRDVTGQFSKSRLNLILRSTGKTEAQFLRDEDAKSKREQLSRGLLADISAPKAFVEATKQYLGEKRTVDVITITKSDVGEIALPSDEQLKTYFESNKARYRAPEYRKISLVELSPETIADDSIITDEQIAQEYEASKAKYSTPEKRNIQQIVFKDKAQAGEALKQLQAGSTFEEIMTKQKVTEEDASIGLLTQKALPDANLAEAAFKLPLNEPSAIIEGKFGPIIARVTEIVEGTTKPLEEIKDDLRKELATRIASDEIEGVYNTLEDARAGGASLAEAAQKAKLTIKTIEAIDARGLDKEGKALEGIPAQAKTLQEVFKTEVGDEASPVDVDLGSYAFFEVLDIEQARERTLEEVKEKVTSDWQKDETTRLLDEKLADYKKQLEGGKSLADLSTNVQNIGPFKRTDELETLSRAAILQGFGTKLNGNFSAAGADENSRILGIVTAIDAAVEGDVTITEQQSEQLKAQIRNELFAELINQLGDNIGVSINQNNINAALNL